MGLITSGIAASAPVGVSACAAVLVIAAVAGVVFVVGRI
jgi:hypothetical protein